jgi:hypothetical protein
MPNTVKYLGPTNPNADPTRTVRIDAEDGEMWLFAQGQEVRQVPDEVVEALSNKEFVAHHFEVESGTDKDPEPYEGYDDRSVDEVVTHLHGADQEEVDRIKEYEANNKDRASIRDFDPEA